MKKTKERRVNAVLKQLYIVHQQLFGKPYTVGALSQNAEFTKIIEAFRELIFTIRHSQSERDKKEGDRKFKQSHDFVRINHEIRQDISRAQNTLAQAVRRYRSDDCDAQYKEQRQKVIKNCYELLKDVKQVEQGGTYHPPQYPTLKQIKEKLIGNQQNVVDQRQSIDMVQEEALERFNNRDAEIDQLAVQVINLNQNIQHKMENNNDLIDESIKKMEKISKKTDHLNERLSKANNDLAAILKNYRRPNQLCLDITLVLLLLALVGVTINLIKGQMV